MIENLIVAAIIAILILVGMFILIEIFNRRVIKGALRNAVLLIEKFRSDNVYVTSLRQESKALAIILHATIIDSRKMREQAIRRVGEIQLPDVDAPLGFSEIEELMVHNKSLFIQTLKGSYKHKIRSLLKEQVKHKVHLAKEAAEEVVKYEVIMTTADGSAPDASLIYETIGGYVGPELKEFEQQLVNIMDELGIIDLSVALVDDVERLIHTQLGEALSDYVFCPVKWLDSIYDIPAATFALKSVYHEFNMLSNSETNIVDSILNISSAVAIRAIMVKTGMIVDGMTGGLGVFTFTAGFLATKISNYIIERENIALRNELKVLEEEVEARLRRMLYNINMEVRECEKRFIKCIEECPDINDSVSLNEFTDEVKQAYSHGYYQAELRLTSATKNAIINIPENKWIYKVCFINPKKAVEKLYLEAQRQITSYHSGLVHNFTWSAEKSVEDGVGFLIRDVVFNTIETEAVAGKLESVFKHAAENYSELLSAWERKTIDLRKQGSKKVATTIENERTSYQSFVAEKRPRMRELAGKIRANNKRQGKGPPK